MIPEQFDQLAAEGHNRIPLMCEVLADLDTPLSVYLKLADGPNSYLFESVQGGEKWGRYSIIGLPCRTLMRVRDHNITVETDGKVIEEHHAEDPLTFIEEFQQRYRVAEQEGLPRFTGGLVGYFGYDTIRYIEPKLAECPNPDTIDNPDIMLLVSDEVVVFDNLRGRLYVIVHVDPTNGGNYDSGKKRLQTVVERMRECLPDQPERPRHEIDESHFISGFTEKSFKQAVERTKGYILDGDCMQVVLSQRLSIPFHASPLDLYRALRGLNPSPYMYFLNLADFHIVGSSPEILARLEDNEVTVRPIAGTRRRGHTDEE
ncbi:MAG: chorismate-binding protein, partial [Sedimenticolaceae bacterium]